MAAGSPFFDLPRLLQLRALVRELDPAGPPSFREVAPPRQRLRRRLGLLPGSFNPLTNAHVALARVALGSGNLDALDFVIATRTVDKERIARASVPDRLICLIDGMASQPDAGVALISRGLYVQQAEIVRAAMPWLDELWFVVGYDKIVQIFDPRYYDDREAALRRLFAMASLLVFPRGPAGPEALSALLARPENQRYAAGVRPLDLPAIYRDLSSTRAREAASRGEDLAALVPPIVVELTRATGVYQPPLQEPDGERIDRYELRERLIDAAESGQLPILPPASLQRLLDLLCEPGEAGRQRRAALIRGELATVIAELHGVSG